MIKEEDVEILKKQLLKLYKNYVTKVTEKTPFSRPTVSKFFNNQEIRSDYKAVIYDAALELLQEHKDAQKSRSRKAQQLLGGEPQTSLNLQ